ncbi:T9SS type A sorting domain-containing protein [Flavobacterium sedimenticola]|uniref:T9SS type A sorting domain-containing protein n=1 Tax=Flavobacterium sedimenticola TaxID=3043286 RepID=A0ABT6XSA8_9FLAO|nr:T9SS type A sorting domain-containing protein [Flavobacterium sedimenticola]MDI9257898.1 T9SS type A sorting domain-containing protein [Flavobacterium sedimenticola]
MKIKNYLLSLALFANCFVALNAQTWSFYKELPVNVTPVDIDVNNAGTFFMLSADNRFFYKPLNGNWQEMSNGDGTAPISPQNISCQKNSNTIFVGDSFGGGIYYTSDFGQTWNQTFLETNPVSGFHEPVYELTDVTSANNFFGGSFGSFLQPYIIRYTNGGQSGQIFEFDPTDNPQNIPAELLLTQDNALLIGTDNGGIWITQNNGQTFQQTNFNQHQVYRFAEDSATGRVYALGQNLSQNQLFLIYSDDYINWTPMPLPNNNEKYTCLFFDDATQSLWLGSESGIHKMFVNGGGQIWSSTLFNNPQQFSVEIIADSNNTIYNFNKQYIAQKLTNGNSWTPQIQGLRGTITTFLFDNNNRIYSSSYFNSTISFATGQSSPWENQVIGNLTPMNRIFKTNDNTIYATKANQILKSVDSGLTYTLLNNPGAFPLLGLVNYFVSDDGTIFAIHNFSTDVLYVSEDDGNTWNMMHDFDPQSNLRRVQNISKDSSGRICVTLQDTAIGTEEFIYSIDNGATWQNFTAPESLAFMPSGYFYAKGDDTYFVLDGQQLFRVINNPLPELAPVNLPFAPYFTSDVGIGNFKVNHLDHMFFYSGFELYKSEDKGITWINLGRPQELNPTNPYIEDYNFDSVGDAYVIVDSRAINNNVRGIYKVTQNLLVNNPNATSISIYPNPVKNTLNFNIQGTVKDITIFDVTGKKIMEKQNWNSNAIEIGNLTNGVYFVNIVTSEETNSTIKFIKE